ncbi:hypothetical protein GN244_ATG07107 [Phytophthora infestans]|uniref:Uncharacterized protein n=1 Tax=Phytophthora infestans TaxID=4787 RepID=A0A833TGX6_PHYIN|nr:hypothetical protein GN244_ATG07107 [Phytophthora infestans]KAF4127668.1 hypothetical protein GN958_ATG23154 [Phytophthora infestans]
MSDYIDVHRRGVFPASSEIAALDGNEDTKTEEDEEQHAVCSRSRPVALSAIEDTAVVTTKGEPQQPRGRYIMSTRLEALPTTKRILYEYPIPKEVLDALERHRHFHVDDSSPLTAFKPIRLPHPTPTELYSATCTNIVWECFYRHSVPVERSPVSFVLSSLDVAPERPLPPASDLFHLQQLIAATTDDSILYTNYVICMTALTTFIETFERRYIANWTSNFLKISRSVDPQTPQVTLLTMTTTKNMEHTQPNVQFPAHLRRQRIVSTAESDACASTKWKFLQNGMQAGAELSLSLRKVKQQYRLSAVNALSSYIHAKVVAIASADTEDGEGGVRLDPVPMNPHWSTRFELTPACLRGPPTVDLINRSKSSCSVTSAHAVFHSVTASCRRVEYAGDDLTKYTAMLQALTASTGHVREILLVTHVEVGDFVMYHGDFNLTKMEHDVTEI